MGRAALLFRLLWLLSGAFDLVGSVPSTPEPAIAAPSTRNESDGPKGVTVGRSGKDAKYLACCMI